MSFRKRLTGFFVVIVVVPMVAVGLLVFRLIGDSSQGKADARASGVAATAASVYGYASRSAQLDAETLARDPVIAADVAAGSRAELQARLSALAAQAGLARVVVSRGSRTLADIGDPTAVAPGTAQVASTPGIPGFTVKVSTLSATAYASQLAGPTVAVVVRTRDRVLASTFRSREIRQLPRNGTVTLGGIDYRSISESFAGFFRARTRVTVLSNLTATESSVQASQLVAGIFIAIFLLLALAFSMLASRALHGQISRFLAAAKRLGGGDFSSPVPIEGRDEFAALGVEFNNMSKQLEQRIYELGQARARLRESIGRIGLIFASNLDRPALLEHAMSTAVDAIHAECGRLSVRTDSDQPLSETVRVGSLDGLEQAVVAAERRALAQGAVGEAQAGETSVASVPLLPLEPGGKVQGLITVARRGPSLSDEDREVLGYLAAQATLALDSVELHHQVQRQAVTDELTGLANHGRFQELLSGELEQVRRYQHPVGLIMLDVDDFKAVNDTYGHPQGDIVLKRVARVVRESSREADSAARYGGEEMALILPHTDLEGSHAIAERVRTAIEELEIRRLDQDGVLRITASFGVAASTAGDKDALIGAADAALYSAKRQGKNRTVCGPAQTAHVFSGE